MEPLGQYVSEQSEPRNFVSAFFERRPLRSYYFIAGTVMMGMDFALVALVLFRSWSQMATHSRYSKSGLLCLPCWRCGAALTRPGSGFTNCILRPN